MHKIILASQSPRRKQLMEMAEFEFEVVVADVDESEHGGVAQEKVPEYLAAKKARVISSGNPEAIVIAADTIVFIDGLILGKPVDFDDAVAILNRLSGRKHEVISGVCICHKGVEKTFSVVTSVFFRHLTESQIRHYIDRYKPYDKAGAYAIQEWIGVTGIERIDGDYYNVMGLPIGDVIKVLKDEFGISNW